MAPGCGMDVAQPPLPQTGGAVRSRAERLGREAVLAARRAAARAVASPPRTVVFFRQAEAFHAADVAFLSCPLDAKWRGKVFSQERPSDGVRRFAFAADVREFWRSLCAEPPGLRHWYEIIRDDTPCHLYFDVEFKTGSGLPTVADGVVACRHLLWWAAAELARVYGVHVRRQDVVVLESSTPVKFSRHLVVRLPDGSMFRDARHVGAFVQRLVEGLQRARGSCTAIDAMWVAASESKSLGGPGTAASGAPMTSEEPLSRHLLIDLGVYTRNRAMRLLFCSKYKKAARLLPAAENAYPGDASNDPHMPRHEGVGAPDAAAVGVLHDYWVPSSPCRAQCIATRIDALTSLPVASFSLPEPPLDASSDRAGPLASHGPAEARVGTAEVLPSDPRNATSVAAVLVGSSAWEAAVWRGSLITDLLAPLWLEEGRAELLATAEGGISSLDTVERWLAHRAAAAPGSCAPYAAPLHPTQRIRLLYCEGAESRGREGEVAVTALAASSRNDSVLPTANWDNSPASGVKRSRAAEGAPRGVSLPPTALSRLPVTILGGPASASPPPFPALVAWVLRTLASRAGVEPRAASLRSWQAECIDVTLIPCAASAAAVPPVTRRVVAHLRLDTCGSRWCARIGRHHRSNNVAWHISLARQVVWQTCYDPECRAMRFASAATPLPPELVPNQVPLGLKICTPGSDGQHDGGGSHDAGLASSPPQSRPPSEGGAARATGTGDEDAALDAEIASFLDAYEAGLSAST